MQEDFKPKIDSGGILWDGFGLQTLYSGVGRHAWDLLQALHRASCAPQIIPSAPQMDSQFLSQTLAGKSFWPVSKLKPWSLFVAGQWVKSYLQSSTGPCIIHGLSNYNIPAIRSPRLHKVLTVHDLIPILQPEVVSKALGYFLRYQMPRAVEAAAAIICVSQWTEDAMQERYPHSRGKTVVIPNGWAKLSPASPNQPVEIPMLLTVSRMEAYKRLHLIPEILQHLPPNMRWTVVTDGRGYEFLQSLQDSRLILRTQVSDEVLQALHRSAQVYVHPSLWEGFCLPASASISSGVPVLYTRGSGIDEVVQGAGRQRDSNDTAAQWADSIQELLAVPDSYQLCLQRYQSAPSWDNVAASTRALYAKLGER